MDTSVSTKLQNAIQQPLDRSLREYLDDLQVDFSIGSHELQQGFTPGPQLANERARFAFRS
jgi:hypothetical protein